MFKIIIITILISVSSYVCCETSVCCVNIRKFSILVTGCGKYDMYIADTIKYF